MKQSPTAKNPNNNCSSSIRSRSQHNNNDHSYRGPPREVDVSLGLRLDDPLLEEEILKEVMKTTTASMYQTVNNDNPAPARATAATATPSASRGDGNHQRVHAAPPPPRGVSSSTSGRRQFDQILKDTARTGTTTATTRTLVPPEEYDDSDSEIQGVISSFNQELENLERSFNELASSQQQYSIAAAHSRRLEEEEEAAAAAAAESRENSALRGNLATTPRRGTTYRNYGLSSQQRQTSATTTDPPPSSARRTSPLRFSKVSTPQRTSSARGVTNSGRSYRSSYGGGPDPVETPGPAVNMATRSSSHNRSGSDVLPSNSSGGGDWETTLNHMRATLRQQEERILELERENKDLRRALAESDTGRRQPPSPSQQYASYGTRRSAYHQQQPSEEDWARSGMTFHSTQLSTPPRESDYFQDTMEKGHDNDRNTNTSRQRRIDVILENTEQEFTPGTRFVAELARLMRMENGHHAPLSVMLDKHWDRLKYFMQDD